MEGFYMTADNPSDFPYEEVSEESRPEVLRSYWGVARGLQAASGLQMSERLCELAQEHIADIRDLAGTRELLFGIHDGNSAESAGVFEADCVALRTVELLVRGAFLFSPEMLRLTQKYLFQDLDSRRYRLGEYRCKLVTVEDGVMFAAPELINAALQVAFKEESVCSYGRAIDEAAAKNLAQFITRMWQARPFIAGNTTTIMVFLVLYLHNLGYDVDGKAFEKQAGCLRDALVRAAGSRRTEVTDSRELEGILMAAFGDGSSNSE